MRIALPFLASNSRESSDGTLFQATVGSDIYWQLTVTVVTDIQVFLLIWRDLSKQSGKSYRTLSWFTCESSNTLVSLLRSCSIRRSRYFDNIQSGLTSPEKKGQPASSSCPDLTLNPNLVLLQFWSCALICTYSDICPTESGDSAARVFSFSCNVQGCLRYRNNIRYFQLLYFWGTWSFWGHATYPCTGSPRQHLWFSASIKHCRLHLWQTAD